MAKQTNIAINIAAAESDAVLQKFDALNNLVGQKMQAAIDQANNDRQSLVDHSKAVKDAKVQQSRDTIGVLRDQRRDLDDYYKGKIQNEKDFFDDELEAKKERWDDIKELEETKHADAHGLAKERFEEEKSLGRDLHNQKMTQTSQRFQREEGAARQRHTQTQQIEMQRHTQIQNLERDAYNTAKNIKQEVHQQTQTIQREQHQTSQNIRATAHIQAQTIQKQAHDLQQSIKKGQFDQNQQIAQTAHDLQQNILRNRHTQTQQIEKSAADQKLRIEKQSYNDAKRIADLSFKDKQEANRAMNLAQLNSLKGKGQAEIGVLRAQKLTEEIKGNVLQQRAADLRDQAVRDIAFREKQAEKERAAAATRSDSMQDIIKQIGKNAGIQAEKDRKAVTDFFNKEAKAEREASAAQMKLFNKRIADAMDDAHTQRTQLQKQFDERQKAQATLQDKFQASYLAEVKLTRETASKQKASEAKAFKELVSSQSKKFLKQQAIYQDTHTAQMTANAKLRRDLEKNLAKEYQEMQKAQEKAAALRAKDLQKSQQRELRDLALDLFDKNAKSSFNNARRLLQQDQAGQQELINLQAQQQQALFNKYQETQQQGIQTIKDVGAKQHAAKLQEIKLLKEQAQKAADREQNNLLKNFKDTLKTTIGAVRENLDREIIDTQKQIQRGTVYSSQEAAETAAREFASRAAQSGGSVSANNLALFARNAATASMGSALTTITNRLQSFQRVGSVLGDQLKAVTQARGLDEIREAQTNYEAQLRDAILKSYEVI